MRVHVGRAVLLVGRGRRAAVGCVDDEFCTRLVQGAGRRRQCSRARGTGACVAPPSPPPHPSACADPLYVDQWHLRRVRAEEAWDVVVDSSSTVVVVDDGVQYAHEDLDVDRARSFGWSLTGTRVPTADAPTRPARRSPASPRRFAATGAAGAGRAERVPRGRAPARLRRGSRAHGGRRLRAHAGRARGRRGRRPREQLGSSGRRDDRGTGARRGVRRRRRGGYAFASRGRRGAAAW